MMASCEAPGAGPTLAVAGSVGPASEEELGRMRKAMALRVKYRKHHRVGLKNVYKIRVAIRSLAVHLKNRGAVSAVSQWRHVQGVMHVDFVPRLFARGSRSCWCLR